MSYVVERLKRERKDFVKFSNLKSKLRESDSLIFNYWMALKNGEEKPYLDILSSENELLLRTENIPKCIENRDIESILVGEANAFRESLRGLVEFNLDIKGYFNYGEKEIKGYGSLL